MNILICGSNESGKSTFAGKLNDFEKGTFDYYKDEDIVSAIDGTDISMSEAIDFCVALSVAKGNHCIVDYKAPTDSDKAGFDKIVYMNTLEEEDADFELPSSPDYTITEELIGDEINEIMEDLE